MARVRPGQLLRRHRWTYWDGARWVGRPAAARPLIAERGGVSQTLSVFEQEGRWFALSKRDDVLGEELVVWTATSPTGPFDDGTAVARLPCGAGTLTYLPLAHPDLLPRPGTVVVSWSRNSGLAAACTDPATYRHWRPRRADPDGDGMNREDGRTDHPQRVAEVVVGVDGTPRSDGALLYAAREARLRGGRVRVVHVVPSLPAFAPAELSETGLRVVGTSIVERAVAAVHGADPELEVSSEVLLGPRVGGLVGAAAHADLLVLGRDDGSSARFSLRAHTGTGAAARSATRVVVVPSTWTAPEGAAAPGRVVVGVKSVLDARELLAEAFAEARMRGATLVVVTAWYVTDPYRDRIEVRTGHQDWTGEGLRWLDGLLAEWRDAHPDVAVETGVRHGTAPEVLLEASEGAALLLVARHRHVLPSNHLGRTTAALLRLSQVPVQVAAPTGAEQPERPEHSASPVREPAPSAGVMR